MIEFDLINFSWVLRLEKISELDQLCNIFLIEKSKESNLNKVKKNIKLVRIGETILINSVYVGISLLFLQFLERERERERERRKGMLFAIFETIKNSKVISTPNDSRKS